MKTIKELLEIIHEMKNVHELSWNGNSYDLSWNEVLRDHLSDEIEREIASTLIHNMWNETEIWLIEIQKKEHQNKLVETLNKGQGFGITNLLKGYVSKFNGQRFQLMGFEDSLGSDNSLIKCVWPECEHIAYLYIHEIDPVD